MSRHNRRARWHSAGTTDTALGRILDRLMADEADRETSAPAGGGVTADNVRPASTEAHSIDESLQWR